MWSPFDEGKTLGSTGSEQGTIVVDEEWEKSARITIEENGAIAPWSFTCGIYGHFAHTALFGSKVQIERSYQEAKLRLVAIMEEQDGDKALVLLERFVEDF